VADEYPGPERRSDERRSEVDRRDDSKQTPADYAGPDRRVGERRSDADRRGGEDHGAHSYSGPERRRKGDRRSVVDRRGGLERRRGPGRRRSDTRREAEEGEMTDELLEFVLAIDDYKRVNSRPFPSWSEVFEVIRYLGYRKVAGRGEHIDRPAGEPPASA